MFKALHRRITGWAASWICSNIIIGGHCGLCGKWVSDCLVPYYWRITICDDCTGDNSKALEEAE